MKSALAVIEPVAVTARTPRSRSAPAPRLADSDAVRRASGAVAGIVISGTTPVVSSAIVRSGAAPSFAASSSASTTSRELPSRVRFPETKSSGVDVVRLKRRTSKVMPLLETSASTLTTTPPARVSPSRSLSAVSMALAVGSTRPASAVSRTSVSESTTSSPSGLVGSNSDSGSSEPSSSRLSRPASDPARSARPSRIAVSSGDAATTDVEAVVVTTAAAIAAATSVAVNLRSFPRRGPRSFVPQGICPPCPSPMHAEDRRVARTYTRFEPPANGIVAQPVLSAGCRAQRNDPARFRLGWPAATDPWLPV